VTLSLGEATVLAAKAARGAGLPWGLAEEAGRAARWLEARGAPGLLAIAALCEAREAGTAAQCPLRLGCAVADGARAPAGDLGPVSAPLLLAPFLAAHADPGATTSPLADTAATAIRADGAEATVSAETVAPGPEGWAPFLAVARVTLAPAAAPPAARPRRSRADPAAAARLEPFAARLLAPSDPRTRATGAGPGVATDD